MNTEYQICTRCIMDTSDIAIEFDAAGICNHCREYERLRVRHLITDKTERDVRLRELTSRIIRSGKGKDYDCIIGLSGGVDSSYIAYLTKELGLRPLAVHLDNGWNSELAMANIERMVKSLGLDLYTHVIDWEEFRDLQLAFFRASVIDIELLTDHAIFAVIYRIARKFGVKFFLSGYNVATESVMPRSWFYGNKLDSLNISALHRQFGNGKKLHTFPLLSLPELLHFVLFRTVEIVPLLNYIDYHKAEAMKVLQKKLGWVYYGGKHYESRFTQFYQASILPRKFKVDKRRAHLSSLIYSGQLTRAAALREIGGQIYTPDREREDREYVLKKLGLSPAEFEEYLGTPPRSHYDFPSYDKIYRKLRRALRLP